MSCALLPTPPPPLPQSILQKALESIKDGAVISLVVNAVLNNFRPEYISSRALMFADMIRDCEEIGMPKVHLP